MSFRWLRSVPIRLNLVTLLRSDLLHLRLLPTTEKKTNTSLNLPILTLTSLLKLVNNILLTLLNPI